MKYNVTESKLKIYLAVKMRLALGKKEFMSLVVLKNCTDNLADDLRIKLYDLGCLIKHGSPAVSLLLLRLTIMSH